MTSLRQHQFPVRNGSEAPTLLQNITALERAVVWIHHIDSPQEVICSGILVSDRVVLTAGHCVTEPINLAVSRLSSVDAKTYPVRSAQVHTHLDLGMLALHTDVPNTAPFLMLNREIQREWIGTSVEAAGFGEDFDLATDAALRYAELTIVALDDTEIVVDGFGERGLCFGDSGAPVFSESPQGDPVLLAIASHGDASCLGRDYLMRLNTVREWLEEVITIHSQSDESLCDAQRYPLPQCVDETRLECLGNQLESTSCHGLNRKCLETTEGAACIASTVATDTTPNQHARDSSVRTERGDDAGDELIPQDATSGCMSGPAPHKDSPSLTALFLLSLVCSKTRKQRIGLQEMT